MNRFAIGLIIFTTDFSLIGWIKGLTIGLFFSLSDTLITKVSGQIIGMGMIGRLIIGIFEQQINKRK